jgi:hypothetical protein
MVVKFLNRQDISVSILEFSIIRHSGESRNPVPFYQPKDGSPQSHWGHRGGDLFFRLTRPKRPG